jgi:cobalt/nickel transport system permease protein
MGFLSLVRRASLMDSIDPRARIVTAILFSLVVAAANDLSTVGIAMAMAVSGSVLAKLRLLGAARRLVPVNVFAIVLIALLPLTAGQSTLVAFGPIHYSKEGLLLALAIALKTNAIVLGIMVLLGSLDLITLGHALRHLGLPDKLAHLLLFTVRYVDVLHGEYVRLRAAMKTRGFRPRVNAHTYRSYGHLVGMLLVRSLDRSERIVAAMKCRGFRGRFYLLDRFAFCRRDVWFVLAASCVLLLLAVLECS